MKLILKIEHGKVVQALCSEEGHSFDIVQARNSDRNYEIAIGIDEAIDESK